MGVKKSKRGRGNPRDKIVGAVCRSCPRFTSNRGGLCTTCLDRHLRVLRVLRLLDANAVGGR